MDPGVSIMNALEFAGLKSREHLEVPLPEIINPFREIVFSMGGTDDGLEAFLRRNRKQLAEDTRRIIVKRKTYHG